MEFKAKLFSGSLPIFLDASNLSPQVTFLQNPFHPQFIVTQGSVLGPILFTLYSQPFSNIIQKHQFDYHKYADDTEYQKEAPLSDFSQVSRETTACVPNVKVWMNKDKFKLHDEKAELLVRGDCTRLSLVRKELLTLAQAQFLSKHQQSTRAFILMKLCP